MIPLERLRQQYYYVKYYKIDEETQKYREIRYQAMREFCLDCNLATFDEVETMENEM